MDIDSFKKLAIHEKLKEIKYNGNILGSYDRNAENGGSKTPGDIYALFDFWVYLSPRRASRSGAGRRSTPTRTCA